MIMCWGATLIGLVLLIGLNKGWKVVSEATKISGYLFTISWIALLLAIIWLFQITGQWQLTSVLTNENVAQFGTLEKTGINLLIIVAVMIPAAQWPFQRWLIESAVAPTPVSAIMHAGLVNAGGIMLTRFSPLFHDDIAQIILLIFSSISVLIGTGISLVQVDYKRQLVGSTIAQMGFMLIQCALGAYLAAVIHLILHGLFKATLFLQAGSSVQRVEVVKQSNKKMSNLWMIVGRVLGLFIAIAFWFITSGEGYQLVSALILGWSLYFSWKQLVVFGEGRMGRIAGLIVLIGFTLIYFTVHNSLYKWLHTDMYESVQPSAPTVIFVICILLFSSVICTFVTRNQSSTLSAVLYLWSVRVGEARRKSVESHPSYLKHDVSKGGNS